ncbi:MAG: sigma-70 family RNA polymerase sigma factor [Acidobacteria bacterium]|nr:sigma-70 family RNA polymerase sigma factor [Acidobacteriota bacterium]
MAVQSEPAAAATEARDRDRAEYAALVREAAAGNRTAMERLLMRAQEVAYRFSVLVCGHPEDAEDVMQEALLRTFQYVRRIDDPSAFRTWLYSTVRNACLMKRRRRAGEPAALVPLDAGARGEAAPMDVADRTAPIDEQMVRAAVDARLRTALETLPPAYRIIVVLREMEGLSTREVATITGYSEANVKQRLHRARLMLRQHLEDA